MDKIKTIILDIKTWLYDLYLKIRYPFRYTYRGISNIIRWIPILWNDRDWDQWYIYNILEFKLKNQAEHISKCDIHVRSQQDAAKMLLCTRLIAKIKEGYYEMEYMHYVKSIITVTKLNEKDLSELNVKTTSDNSAEFINKHKAAFNRLLKDRSYWFNENGELANMSSEKQASHLSTYNQDRARKLLFKIMEENIELWWD